MIMRNRELVSILWRTEIDLKVSLMKIDRKVSVFSSIKTLKS